MQTESQATPTCAYCGEAFSPDPHNHGPDEQKYCNRTCKMYAYHERRAKRRLAERLLREAGDSE